MVCSPVPQDGNTSTTTTKISGQQIVSAPMALKNKTGMDLSVNASVATTIPAAADGEVAMKLAANTTKGVGSSPDGCCQKMQEQQGMRRERPP